MKYDYENVLEYAVEQGEARGREEGRAEGREEGRSEGLIEGENKGKRETAKNMLNKGFEYAIIFEITGLSQKEIQSL